MQLKAHRLHRAFGGIHEHGKRQSPNPSCKTGGFIQMPTAHQVVNNNDPFDIKWDVSCLNSSAVDIYLYAPGASQSLIHVWQSVPYTMGAYQASLRPKWWNATADIDLQLSIVPSNSPGFMRTYPAGNVFHAHYDAPASGKAPEFADTTNPDPVVELVRNSPNGAAAKKVSKGGIAAAVIIPLLVLAFLVGVFVRLQRQKRTEKSKRWSEAVDKRMSTIAPDWQAITPGGAQSAVRSSIAASRMSYAFGRPSSTFALEGGQAGIGASGYTADDMAYGYMPQMSQQTRPDSSYSVTAATRASRISFAADTRPSRSFHQGYVPPVPGLPNRKSSDELVTSPTQTAGPLTLTPDDIRARVSGTDNSTRPSIEEVMPALSLMRTGIVTDPHSGNDMLLQPPSPVRLAATITPPKSPVGHMPMEQQTITYMSPDAMLRQYAAQRSPGVPTVPSPSYSGSSMRVLYSPSVPSTVDTSEQRKSIAKSLVSQYSEDDVYAGMGHH